jgi:hypothetical protein
MEFVINLFSVWPPSSTRLLTLYMHSNISACLEALLIIIFSKSFHYCCLITLNIFKWIKMRPFQEDHWEHWKSDKESNQLSKADMSTLVSVSWPNITLLKVLCGKAQLKIHLSGQRFCLFNKYISVNNPKLEQRLLHRLLVLKEQIHNGWFFWYQINISKWPRSLALIFILFLVSETLDFC